MLVLLLFVACDREPVAPIESPPALSPPPPPAMLTDEECRARGGRIWTEKDAARLDKRYRQTGEPLKPFRVCRIPAAENGRECTDSDQCGQGRCLCTGALSRPNPQDDPSLAGLDEGPGTGTCSDEPLPTGDWFCLVEGGRIQLRGIIID